MLDFWIYSSFFSLYQSSAVLFFGQEHIRSVLLQDFFDGKLVGQAYLTFCIYLFFGHTLTCGWLACFSFLCLLFYFPPRVSWLHYFSFLFYSGVFCFIRVTVGKQYWVVLLRYPKNFAMFKEIILLETVFFFFLRRPYLRVGMCRSINHFAILN